MSYGNQKLSNADNILGKMSAVYAWAATHNQFSDCRLLSRSVMYVWMNDYFVSVSHTLPKLVGDGLFYLFYNNIESMNQRS